MAIIFVIDGKEGGKIRLINIPRIGETVNVKRATGTDTYLVDSIDHYIDMSVRSGVSDMRINLISIKNIRGLKSLLNSRAILEKAENDIREQLKEERTGAL